MSTVTTSATSAAEGASTHTVQQPTPLQFPQYMAWLIDRAGNLMRAYSLPRAPVPFAWWADGQRVRYLATWEWLDGEPGPRAVVLTARDAERVCASLPGCLWAIDAATVRVNAPPEDETDRHLWQQNKRNEKRRSR